MWTKFKPGLKSTIALWHANSAGSTCSTLNRVVTSCRTRMSECTWWPPDFPLPVGPPDTPPQPEVAAPAPACAAEPPECATWSATANNGEDSIGRLHCTAQRRNNSDHDSSSRITCAVYDTPLKAVITIAIRLRYDYDPTIRRIARACFHSTRFDASKKMNISIFRRSHVIVVVSQSNRTQIVISITFFIVECRGGFGGYAGYAAASPIDWMHFCNL